MPVRLEITMTPSAALLSGAFDALGLAFTKFDDPLRECVEKVMAPSIRQNFDSGGRPPWDADEPQTLERKAKYGGSGVSGPLVRTGALRDAASSVEAWDFSSDRAELSNVGVDYGIYHQEGTSRMPARPWAVIQLQDEEAMAEVFGDWMDRRVKDIL
jgi:phage gpG-like protein